MWRVTSRLICLFWVATVISGCASDKLLNVRTLSKAPKGEIVFLKKVGSWEVTDKFESTDSATERISIDKENKQIAVLYTNVTGNSYVSKKSGGRSNALKGFLACETDDINRIEDSYNPCNSSFYITDRTSTALSQTIGSALLLGLPTLAEAVKGSYWFHVNFAPNLVLSAAKEAGLIQDGSWNVVFPHYSYATFANANRKDVPKFASNPKIDKKRKSNETAKIVIPKTQQQPKLGSSGSGFFVSRMGHVVTNAHVVKDCSRLTIGDNANKQTADL